MDQYRELFWGFLTNEMAENELNSILSSYKDQTEITPNRNLIKDINTCNMILMSRLCIKNSLRVGGIMKLDLLTEYYKAVKFDSSDFWFVPISGHKTGDKYLAFLALSNEEREWMEIYFKDIRRLAGKKDLQRFFIPAKGKELNLTKLIEKYQERYIPGNFTVKFHSSTARKVAETANLSLAAADPEHRSELVAERLSHSEEVANSVYRIANFEIPFVKQQKAYLDSLMHWIKESNNENIKKVANRIDPVPMMINDQQGSSTNLESDLQTPSEAPAIELILSEEDFSYIISNNLDVEVPSLESLSTSSPPFASSDILAIAVDESGVANIESETEEPPAKKRMIELRRRSKLIPSKYVKSLYTET